MVVCGCDADIAEGAVLRTSWFGEVACSAEGVGPEDDVVVWVVTKAFLMVCWNDVVRIMSGAEVSEKIR